MSDQSELTDLQHLIEDLQRNLEEGWLGVAEVAERLRPEELQLLRAKPDTEGEWSQETVARLMALVEMAERRREREPEPRSPGGFAQPQILARHGTAAHEVMRLHALLVEFEAPDRLHLIQLLDQARDIHFEMSSAENVEQATTEISRGNEPAFDVVLLNLTRAAGSGTALLARAEIVTCGVPVVAIVNREEEPQLIHMGARNYLVKSELDTRLLSRTLRTAVEHQQLADALESSHRREHFLATRDTMTGLPNRFAFHEQLQHAIHYAERNDQQVAVLSIDLDRFKHINDTLGHEVGDSLLITLAERMSTSLRKSDLIARTGGDEFLLMLQGRELDYAPARTAERVLESLAAPFMVDGREHGMSASIGIASYPRDGHDPDALIRHADAAMYQAKAEGRGRYRFFSKSVNAVSLRRMEVESRLRLVLERGDLRVHYQPRVDGRDGRILGAEALLRWNDPDLGEICPAEFIPIAEQSGLVSPIGDWVMSEACRVHAEWAAAGFDDLLVSVNVSAHQIRTASLRDAVVRAVVEGGIRPGKLEIELTESALIDNHEQAAGILGELAEIGVELSLDDFGAGFSSLSYLKQFPVRTLKIDPSFVHDITSAGPSSSIIDAILALARTLGLTVVAEGVETEAQRAALLARGCTEMQGFHFSRPLEAEKLMVLLRAGGRLATPSD